MKRSTLILTILVLGLVVSDFIAAPMTGMGLLKRTVGAQLVMREAKAAFQSNGVEGADAYCQQPQKRLGYWYKCKIGGTFNYTPGRYTVEVTIHAYDPIPNGYRITLHNGPLQ